MFPEEHQAAQPDSAEAHKIFVSSPQTGHQPQTEPVHQPMYPEATKGIASVAQPVFEPKAASQQAESAFGQVPTDDRAIAVVKVLSVRGVEYGMMTISLWIAASSLLGILVTMINGLASFSILAFPVSTLLVSMPAFAFFFLRLKKAELSDPSLRLEASKRRFSQITQFVAFITCMVNAIFFIYLIMGKFGGASHTNWGKAIGTLLVIFVVAGGILAYYWVDEHKLAVGK